MKKVFSLLFASALSTISLCADNDADSTQYVKLDEIVVSAIRVSNKSSVAYSDINEQSIKSDNAARNVPALLQVLPSVVSYTEGGTPVGNTNFRIRGTDANRINMTLNGMPLNNPETQEVYWVNLPDISNSLKSIQVQRGVGSATAGTASFGGSISMQTVGSRNKPYAEISNSFGQYNTYLGSVATGTGILKNGLAFDARYSYTRSDGYIRNGKVDHKNLYASVAHYTDKQMVKLTYINGIQHTGITWEGISPDDLEKYGRRYNPAGKYKDADGNTQFYDNETDNYYSNIIQAQYSRFINNNVTLNANFGFNNGYGYYENYKVDEKFATLGLPNFGSGDDELSKTDIIRRKLMSNNLYSGGMNLTYKASKVDVTIGANYTFFEGDHYGRLLWVKHNQNIPENYEWYRNKSEKKDFNNFAKITYTPIEKLALTAELQGRFVEYEMKGIDDKIDKKNKGILDGKNNWMFFNPKVGTTYLLDAKSEVYASFAISNREPLRADLKESIKGEGAKPVKSERLFDYEFGYRYTTPSLFLASNFYYMNYDNQLVQTGRLSDTGYKYQENVKDSYRYGVELEAMYSPTYWIGIGGNLTLSQNKIKNYTAYFDQYDNATNWNKVEQATEFHKKTNISFSPNVVGAAILKFKPLKDEDFNFSFTNKYVGSMYYDNTSDKDNKLDDYFVTDFQISYSKSFAFFEKVDFQFMVNNIFNKKYFANAWVDTYKFADGSKDDVYKGLFPQAGTNVMGRITMTF